MSTTTRTRDVTPRRSGTSRGAGRRGGGPGVRTPGLPWILPALVVVVGLIYYSIGYTAYTSTLDWDGISPDPTSVGFDNYAAMVRDPIFYKALTHTVTLLVVGFVVQTALGFAFAAMLHARVRLATLHKVIIFVPTVLAPASMAPVFRLVFDAKGYLNQGLTAIGLDGLTHPWLADSRTALPCLIVISVWQFTGLTFILYYAAMGQIDPEVLEAARIDGAGNLRVLWHVVWPGCRGTTVALAILSTIGALKTFDIPWLVTTGGPAYATEFLGTYIYRQGIKQAHIGYAGTLSIALLVLAVAGALLMYRGGRADRKDER